MENSSYQANRDPQPQTIEERIRRLEKEITEINRIDEEYEEYEGFNEIKLDNYNQRRLVARISAPFATYFRLLWRPSRNPINDNVKNLLQYGIGNDALDTLLE